MAPETNKSSNTGNTKPLVVEDPHKTPFFKRISSSGVKKKEILLVFVLALLIVAIGHFIFHIGEKVYAQAAGHKIYKSDVDQLIGNSKGTSTHQAATALANKYLTEALAKEQHISVSDAEINSVYGQGFTDKKNSKTYSYQAGVNQLYFNKLQAYNRGIYTGDLLVAHFSRFIPSQLLTAQNKAAFPQLGNAAAIAADRAYAQNFITDLNKQVKSGKISWSKAAKTEQTNPIVGQSAYPALTHSGTFNTQNAPEPLFTPPDASAEVRKLSPGETSKPFVVRVSTTDKKNVASYYLIVHMTSKKGGQAESFGKYMLQAEKRLRYKINV